MVCRCGKKSECSSMLSSFSAQGFRPHIQSTAERRYSGVLSRSASWWSDRGGRLCGSRSCELGLWLFSSHQPSDTQLDSRRSSRTSSPLRSRKKPLILYWMNGLLPDFGSNFHIVIRRKILFRNEWRIQQRQPVRDLNWGMGKIGRTSISQH